MFSFEELFNAAITKGFKVEAFSIIADRYGDIDTYNCDTVLRISCKRFIWNTWIGCTISGNEPNMFFEGRYNQNNGATQNTYKKECSILFDLGLRSIK